MTDMNRKPDWKKAKKLADELSLGFQTPPIPVWEIAESNGVNVVAKDFGEYSEDLSGFCSFKRKRIYVNARDSRQRRSFTIAHELGHWLLHYDDFIKDPDSYEVLPRFSQPDQNNPFEKEANHFAANLLVPERLLKPVSDAYEFDLARAFGVSRIMMVHRLKNA